MRRLKIVFFWLFKASNNVGFFELVSFFFKPTVRKCGIRYIKKIEAIHDWQKVSFSGVDAPLFWPRHFSIDGLYQVSAETFDATDWHFYQKKWTKVEDGEVLIDVGSAEGLFSLSVVNKCKKIFLIEPNKLFENALRKTFESNQNIVIINKAVGKTAGEMYFNSASLEGKIGHDVASSKLDVVTIDSLFADEEKITYLKADLEGFELEMLLGAEKIIKAHRPKLAITSYHTENDPLKIISVVKGFVPEYNFAVKGIHQDEGKPVMIHFWI